MENEPQSGGKVIDHILGLPDDVLFMIFQYCDAATLCRLAAVCKRLSRLASRDHIWLPHAAKYGIRKNNTERHKKRCVENCLFNHT